MQKSTMAGSSNVLPPYPDIGRLSASDLCNDHIKRELLSKKWETAHLFSFPSRKIGDGKRKLGPKWLQTHHWLRYSVSEDALYCVYCLLFGKKESKEKSFVNPVTDWKNISDYCKRHLASTSQHNGCAHAAENFLSVVDHKKESVISMLSSSHARQVANNRRILQAIIEVIVLCGKQNIPIRGHTDDRSNFQAILHATAKGNPILSDHLAGGDARAKYTSPDIQNELIQLCSTQVRDAIVADCCDAPCFAIIADEATDKATKEQLSMCIRFLDSKQQLVVREEFIGFVHAESIKGDALSQLIVSSIEEAGLNIAKLRAQCYDGASNMSGKYRGVQARIREVAPLANYVHCKAHCLNLALVHSSKEACVRTMMSTVQDVAFAFDYSAKRLTAFSEELSADAETRGQMEQRAKLRTLCETRWSSRADALYTFKTAYPVVVHALETLQEDGDDKAGQHLAAILRFEFIVALVTVEHILSGTVALTNFLQAIDTDLIEAMVECKVVLRRLNDERNDPAVWDALYESAVLLAQDFEIQPRVPRRAGRQQHRDNHPADNPSNYWRVSLFYVFTDHLVEEITRRLLQNEDRFTAEYLVPCKLHNLTDAITDTIYDTYCQDLSNGRDAFRVEVARWKTRWSISDQKPRRLVETLNATNKDLYPDVFMVLSILLTMPASSASAERSFSAMRRIKNFLRATMGDTRLSGLALLHLHRHMDIDIDKVINEFAAAKTRRLDFL